MLARACVWFVNSFLVLAFLVAISPTVSAFSFDEQWCARGDIPSCQRECERGNQWACDQIPPSDNGYPVSGSASHNIRGVAVDLAEASAEAQCGGTLVWDIYDLQFSTGPCSGGVTYEPQDSGYCGWGGTHLGRRDYVGLNAWCAL